MHRDRNLLGVLLGITVACASDAAPDDDDEQGESADEGSTEELPEHASVHVEPPPQPTAIESLAAAYPIGPGDEPPPEPDDGSADDAPHAVFPAPELGLAAEIDAQHAEGNTATNDFHDQFGHAIASGRFASTTNDSIVVAAPYDDLSATNRNSGKLYHYVKSGSNFVADKWVGVGTHNGRAGWSLAVGNFNGDSYDDVAIGMPWATGNGVTQAGAVVIYRGSASGLVLWTTIAQSGAYGTAEYGDRFGWSVAAGDFNNDSKDDLAIGSPGEDNGRGAVYVHAGGALGMTGFAVVTETVLDPRVDWERFGSSLATGDIRGTAHDDLLVGAYAETVAGKSSGRVFLYTGAAATLTGAQIISPAIPEHDQDFGRSLAVADFDANGWEDVAIGIPGATRSAGQVLVLQNDGTTLSQWAVIDETLAGHIPAPGDRFGHALATGDIDNDGRPDLVVGAPREKYNDDSGLAFAFTVPTFLWSPLGSGWRSQAGLGVNQTGDRFGSAVAVVRQTGSDALMVAAPSETLGATGTRSGAVFLYDGGSAFDAWQWISQN